MAKNAKELLEELRKNYLRQGEIINELLAEDSIDDIDTSCINFIKPMINDENSEIEATVTDCMKEFGIPAHIKGYRYLRTAIILVIKDAEIIGKATKELYPTVAQIHGTTPSRVERAIRHAIETSWMFRADYATKLKWFGATVSQDTEKPTNSEFVATIADNIRRNL